MRLTAGQIGQKAPVLKKSHFDIFEELEPPFLAEFLIDPKLVERFRHPLGGPASITIMPGAIRPRKRIMVNVRTTVQ